jgi:hypothetical protein
MYNHKQYDAARDFVKTNATDLINGVPAAMDKLRLKVYDLYEDIYINSTFQLSLVLRGDDQTPLLIPTGKKIIETVNRFLGVHVDYLVEGQGDEGSQSDLDDWFKDWFKREAFPAKFESTKRWGLTRGDAILYLYADATKDPGERVSICEIDPRQVFEIEDIQGYVVGYHMIDLVRDWREPDQVKHIVRRRTFRKSIDEYGKVIKLSPVTMELGFFELNEWDDRDDDNVVTEVTDRAKDYGAHDPITLGNDLGGTEVFITEFPIYVWNNNPMQNTHWGTSQLAGLETLMYAVNQSMTDEDCTIVFQGLGMYVTTAGAPIDPKTGQYCDWNIGPMQIIEIGQDQKFDRVSGVGSLQPFQDHINMVNDKGISESAGIPEVAIGRVDVQSAESGISLKLQFMPLLAQNGEKELGLVNLIDQLFHNLVTQWLPAFEWELFGNWEAMQEMSVVCLFDDPMPTDRKSTIDELVLLKTNNFILMKMVIQKLRSIGYQYPSVDDATGQPLTDDDLVQMLLDEAGQFASAGFPPALPTDPNADPNADPNNPFAPGAPATNGNTPPGKTLVPLTSG